MGMKGKKVKTLYALLTGLTLSMLSCHTSIQTKTKAGKVDCAKNLMLPECMSLIKGDASVAQISIPNMTPSTELADSYISLQESASPSPLFSYVPTTGIKVKYTQPIPTSSATADICDDTQTYNQATIPLVSSLQNLSDGIYMVCLKMTDINGLTNYLASYPIYLLKAPPLVQKIQNVSSAQPVQVVPQVFEEVTYTFTDTTKNQYKWEQTSGPGTIIFSSTDTISTVVAANALGVYGITFTVTDFAGNSTAREFYYTKTPVEFSITPFNPNIATSYNITVSVLDGYGSVATEYSGEIAFSSTDKAAVLPSNYTFTAADQGVHTFSGIKFQTPGSQSLKINNTVETFQASTYSFTVLKKSFLSQLGPNALATIGITDSTGSEVIVGNALQLGLDGYFYISGTTTGSFAGAGSQTGTLDCFVAKMGVDGQLIKLYQFGTSGAADTCVGAFADAEGNMYAAGHTTGAISSSYTNGGSSDIFAVQLKKDGFSHTSSAFNWAYQVDASLGPVIATSGPQVASTAVWDKKSNLYLGFQTDTFIYDTLGAMAFLKMSSGGARNLLKQVTRGADYQIAGTNYANGLALDTAGNIIIAGATDGTFDWNWTTYSGGNTSDQTDAILAKYGPSGSLANTSAGNQWAVQLDASKFTPASKVFGKDNIQSIATDPTTGNIYAVGSTDGNLGNIAHQGGVGVLNAFIALFTADGALSWIKSVGPPDVATANGDEVFTSVATDYLGNAYALGTTASTTFIDPVGGAKDLFVAKYAADGTRVWIRHLSPAFLGSGNASGSDTGKMIYVDRGLNIYIVGYTSSSMGGDGPSSGTNVFFIKLGPDGTL